MDRAHNIKNNSRKRSSWSEVKRSERCAEWDIMDYANRRTLEGSAIPSWHRRFQEWTEQGTFQTILHELAKDLFERGKIDIRETFIDGSFALAKKGSCRRQDKAWQRHQDHGNRRRFWSSCRRMC